MDPHEQINQYDLVEIVQVPEQYLGIMDIGDTGVVVDKFDEATFEVECVRPGEDCTWLARLTIEHIRLKSRDPYHPWIDKALPVPSLMKTSVRLGASVGAAFGGLIGAGLGAITQMLAGILIGAVTGVMVGGLTGGLTAMLTAKIAGTSGGIGVGYFIGMVFGGLLGLVFGALIPPSLRLSAHTEGLPVLDALAAGRFETAVLTGFLLSILGTMVGTWVGGKNFVPRNLKERYR